jgi:hypothetical protein
MGQVAFVGCEAATSIISSEGLAFQDASIDHEIPGELAPAPR